MHLPPHDLSPEERRRAVARILAKGVLRRQLGRGPEPAAEPTLESPASGPECLALSAPSSPDATTG